jgi:hypothetical protein
MLIRYSCLNEVLLGLLSIPLMIVAFVPDAPPVIPPVTAGAGQLYVVPAGTTPLTISAGVTENPDALHTVVVRVFINGFGSTVTVTRNGTPVQFPDRGVTV